MIHKTTRRNSKIYINLLNGVHLNPINENNIPFSLSQKRRHYPNMNFRERFDPPIDAATVGIHSACTNASHKQGKCWHGDLYDLSLSVMLDDRSNIQRISEQERSGLLWRWGWKWEWRGEPRGREVGVFFFLFLRHVLRWIRVSFCLYISFRFLFLHFCWYSHHFYFTGDFVYEH